jgi:LysW-gamma-L-lysine carboxypeptidase
MDNIELLTEMVSIYSPTREESRLAEHLVNVMIANGLHSYVDNAGNVIGSKGEGSKEILLLGHIDTVPGRIPVRVENGVMFGRGCVDAKGSLAAMICALSELHDMGDCRITVIGAVDEEGDSRGARNILKERNPECIIIGEPSGWDAITIGYKGCLKLVYRASRSNRHVGTPDESTPEMGVEFWNNLNEYCRSKSSGSEFDSLSPRLISFNTTNNGLRTDVEMQIDVRIPLGLESEDVKAAIEEFAGNGKIEWTSIEAPIMSSKNSALARAFVSAIREEEGSPSYKKKLGTSDMNILGNHYDVPIVAYGPGDSRLDHTPDERLSLDDYSKSIRVLHRVLSSLVRRKN